MDNTCILVFCDGFFLKQISYKTEKEAAKQYKLFNKKGILDPKTGKNIPNATFEVW